jgi:NTP pyrophosphatase (non-canonical NTP hydrolase)
MSKSISIADIFIKEAIKTESCNFTEIVERLSDKRTIRLLHAAMGLSTEANEFLDALKKWIFYGKELDEVNLAEELGDLFWYSAIAHDELGKSFEEIQIAVIQKLRKRYAEKFNSEEAINRNLNEERTELEKNIDLASGFKMGSRKIVDIVKKELEKEVCDRRQNESMLEYGTRIHKHLEETLKSEGIEDVKIDCYESELNKLSEFGKNFGIGDKVNDLPKLFENNEKLLQELTENIVDRVKIEIIDDEENASESNIPLKIDGQDMVATIIGKLEDGSYEMKMRLATENDKIEYAEEFNEDRTSEDK